MTEEEISYCPGCNTPSPEGTYPPGHKGSWWCLSCLNEKIRKARG